MSGAVSRPGLGEGRARAAVPLGLVFAGGALGTLLRVAVASLSPIGVLLANVTGAFALGVVVARTAEGSRLRWFLGPGLLGAYTTFSAFALELARADAATAAVAATKTVALGLLAAALGLAIGRRR